MRVKCLAQEHNTVIRPGLKMINWESSALTIRPPYLLPSSYNHNTHLGKTNFPGREICGEIFPMEFIFNLFAIIET